MIGVKEPVARVRASLRDPLIVNSSLILTTTLLMAVAGSLFWVIAARLATPDQIGVASSLVSTTEALAVFAQLGLNITLIRTMPSSDRRASDVATAAIVVALFGAVLAVAYGSALPMISPAVSDVVSWPWTIPMFAVLVAATAINQLTDGIFLSINRVASNLRINGILMSIAKIGLPFGLAGAGAFGVFGAVGLSALVAAVTSLVVILRFLPDPPTLRPSQVLRSSLRFSGAGYASNVLYFVPQLVLPVLVINAQGPAQSAIYFISFQIATLLNAGVYAIANSMFAEAARAPHAARMIVRKAGRTIIVATAVGAIILVLASPALLRIFGPEYADEGVPILRILALGSIGVAFNYWAAIRLRIANHLSAMVTVQAMTTIAMVLLGAVLAPLGIGYVAAAWGIGQLFGGIVGYVVSRTIAPIIDTPLEQEDLT